MFKCGIDDRRKWAYCEDRCTGDASQSDGQSGEKYDKAIGIYNRVRGANEC